MPLNAAATGRNPPRFAVDFTTALLDSRITFARALDTATRINSAGVIEVVPSDTPRFDYTLNTGGACKGLLIEGPRTNVVLDSGNVLSANWTVFSEIYTATSVASPSPGPGNVNYFVATSTPGSIACRQFLSFPSGTTWTFSAYIYVPSQTNVSGWRLDNNLSGDYAAGAQQNVFNTWVRVSNTVTMTGDRFIVDFNVLRQQGNSPTAGFNFYIGNIQIEQGPDASSYIPTTSAPVTRNADVATITGTNFSDWWQASEGGVVVRARPGTVSGVRSWLQFDDGTANEIIALRGNTTNPELYIVDGGTPQAQIDAGTIAANTSYRLAGAWGPDSCAASINSGTPVLDGAATVPAATQMRLGSDGTNYLNGWLESIEYYDTLPTSADLQVLSSAAGYRSMIRSIINPVL